METLYNLMLSIGANAIAYYICKWLDGQDKGQ